MAPISRITVRNLLNTITGFPPEITRDPWGRSYTLGLVVIKHFLGEDWIIKHLEPQSGAKGFMKPDLDVKEKEVQFFKAINLGELLFNLQHIEGFDGCVDRMRGGDIEPTLAELDVARMLYVNDQLFWFIEPQGKSGDDYDFRVIFPGGDVACIEAKCNLETLDTNVSTIKNSLTKARGQLPAELPGIIFVKLSPSWLTVQGFEQITVGVAQEFLRTTRRVVSVKYYIAPLYFGDGKLGQGHIFKEITNPQHRFSTSHNWDLLTNWVPPSGTWNKMPKKWVRLVFFPLLDPP
jgi:hypothetical protein